MPWGADLHGFGRREARCFGDDVAVRLMWSSDSYFAACRNAQGSRYLRAWAPGGPGGRNDAPPHAGMQGDFFTETANSLQFVANGAKIDLGPRTVTIVWPRPEGSPVTRSTSYETGAGWTRLN